MTSFDYSPSIEAIIQSYRDLGGISHLKGDHFPSRHRIEQLLDQLKDILFPGYFQTMRSDCATFKTVIAEKVTTVATELTHLTNEDICSQLLAYIPSLRRQLKEDALALFSGDPAAKSEPEIILAYPGFLSTTIYRIAHFLHSHQVDLIPRLMTEIAHSQTGIDIHPGAKIGTHFCIDHGSGVVVGETAVIGNHVKLYQGVTLGALSVSKKNSLQKRHPTVEDHVTIYAGTSILGGTTCIGHHCVIGGNVWITQSIPPHSKVYLDSDQTQILKTEAIDR